MIRIGIKHGTPVQVAARGVATLLLLALASCSSSKSKVQSAHRSEFGPTYRERQNMTDKVIKDKDFAVRSAYEKEIPKSTTEKKSAFGSRNASGLKEYSGTNNAFRSKAFSEADKKSPTEMKTARESKEQSKLATRMFRTPDSRFESQVSRDGSKNFSQGGEIFATRDDPRVAKELKKDKRPVMLDQEKANYTEDDVKRLLNKG